MSKDDQKTHIHTYIFTDLEDGAKLAEMTYQPYKVIFPVIDDRWEIWDEDTKQFLVYKIKEFSTWPEHTEIGMRLWKTHPESI